MKDNEARKKKRQEAAEARRWATSWIYSSVILAIIWVFVGAVAGQMWIAFLGVILAVPFGALVATFWDLR
jgi:hypothetical protein